MLRLSSLDVEYINTVHICHLSHWVGYLLKFPYISA
jgi:hypothetical protein